MVKKKYDWKKTATKVGRSALIVIISGLIAVYGDNPLFLGLIPAAEGLLNYLKHRD
jgi:hypothetical protein